MGKLGGESENQGKVNWETEAVETRKVKHGNGSGYDVRGHESKPSSVTKGDGAPSKK